MEPKPHDMVTCPYNMSHQVEHYRMHIHLQKCRRQYPNSGKTNCPFDSTHVVNEVEMDATQPQSRPMSKNAKKRAAKRAAKAAAKAAAEAAAQAAADDGAGPSTSTSNLSPQPSGSKDSGSELQSPPYHVTTCPKRDMLDTKLYVMDDDQRPAVPVVHSATSDTVLDDWGNEPHVTTYKPDYSKKGAHIIQKIKGATPSERRKARMEGIKNYKPPE